MSRFGILFAIAALTGIAFSYEGGPDPGYTGAPDELTCNTTGCHSSYRLHPDADGELSLTGVPESYTPGQRYTLIVSLSHPTAKRWGFQLTAMTGTGEPAGKFAITDEANTKTVHGGPGGNRDYVEHTLEGTAMDKPNGNSWSFDWIAPESNAGDVNFFAAACAANGNGRSTGDRIYTKSPDPIARSKPPK